MTNTVFIELLDREIVMRQHEAIFLAIAASDPAAALAALHSHVGYLDTVRREALNGRNGEHVVVASLPPTVRSGQSRSR